MHVLLSGCFMRQHFLDHPVLCPMSMTEPPAKYGPLELDTKAVSSFFLERS